MDRKLRGATLVEVAVVVAVVAVTAAVALPSMSDVVQRQRVAGVANQVLAELAHARLQALRQRRRVVVCPSSDGGSCVGGGDWSQGFVTRSSTRHGDGDGAVLRAFDGVDLRGLRLTSGAARPRVVFLPDGRAAGTNLTLTLCDGLRPARRIIVSNTGRARVADADPASSRACGGAGAS